ncbi:hypothetical protein HYH03_008410 [Edaphochlamys debaryana]|uniref:Activator of Hsp90 ATPase AHSA1-like N-terminal domain-containing protein n=1 Tax=Edaphochlamys debaryana TaxID=47281 RepID=A0A836BZC7_9CHLO|nr:hypothetical protein HYH03_008410 [Edaphochlamys debaryana]|eukprot:KAG2493273.1 hypothetical protein HYH03_008410 [Edaphochlamys debaryana]
MFGLLSLLKFLKGLFRPLFGETAPPLSAKAKARAQAKKVNPQTASKSQAQASKPAPKKPPKPAMAEPAPAGADGAKDKTKGELSYHYWHGKGGGEVPLPEPRKLTEAEKAELERQAAANGASAWNAAGTFEERNATSWAKDRLKGLLGGLELAGGEVTVTDVNSVEGEANIFLVRGKKRSGFDLEMQLAWKGVPRAGAGELRGHCKVTGFASDDPDDLTLAPEITGRQAERAADEAAMVSRLQAVLRPHLEALIGQLADELKNK